MSKPLWQQLTELIDSKQDLAALQKKRVTLRAQIEEKRDAIAEASSMLEEKREQKKALRKQIDALELESKELDGQAKAKQKAYENVSGHKEVVALEKELAVIGKTQEDLEARVLAVWQAHETCEKDLASLESTLEEQVGAVEQEIITLEGNLEELDTQEVAFNVQQAEKIAALPELWHARYEHMKDRVENPIIPLLGTTCSQCFYLVLAKDLARIRKGDVLPCRNCYRYLYYTEPTPENEEAS